MKKKTGGLGKGISGKGMSALIPNADISEKDSASGKIYTVKTALIEPNPLQPRKTFDADKLCALSESIMEHGILQPIVVKKNENGFYTIIAGERRWRAAKLAKISEMPVVIKDFDEKEVSEVALIENLQREDLNPVEEALGYRSLMVSFGLTQEQVAEAMGKSRSAVANTLRLLDLTPEETESLKKGKLSAGAARVLVSAAKGSELRATLYRLALAGASVRDLESMAKSLGDKPKKEKAEKPHFYKEVELSLKNELGRKVKITPTAKG